MRQTILLQSGNALGRNASFGNLGQFDRGLHGASYKPIEFGQNRRAPRGHYAMLASGIMSTGATIAHRTFGVTQHKAFPAHYLQWKGDGGREVADRLLIILKPLGGLFRLPLLCCPHDLDAPRIDADGCWGRSETMTERSSSGTNPFSRERARETPQ